MMMIVLRLIHIVIGMFWVGTSVFLAAFLVPAIRGAGPAGGAVMGQLVEGRRMPLFLMGAMAFTVLSGIGLYWRRSNGFSSPWLGTHEAMVFGVGAVFAILSGLIGMTVSSPAGKRLSALMGGGPAGGPPPPEAMAEIERLQIRLGKAAATNAVLLTAATMAMAVARYVG